MAIILENINFKYPNNEEYILKDINLKFCEGEIVALTGKNGCGKTTLTKLLVGILKQESGQIFLDGVDTKSLSITEIGTQIGYVMQNPSLQLFASTVREEIEYGLINQKLPKDEIDYRVDYYLDYFELGKYKEEFPLNLSKGEKQRVVLSAVLAMKPKYILLDEPTASLDVYRTKLLGEYLQKIKKELRCGVIIVSHDKKFVETYSQREIQIRSTF